jgi:hypothetical protein
MHSIAAALLVVTIVATAADAQELTAAVSAYRSLGIDDLDAKLPLSVEIRASIPLSDRFALEPFVTVGSAERFIASGAEGFYGAQIRQRIERLTAGNAFGFITYGAAGYYWKRGGGPPILGHLGFGLHTPVSARLAFRPEVHLVTFHVVPIGERFVAGLSMDLTR